MTVGMYGGKFYPIHSGHVFAMTVASTMVDELHVIVSYDDEFEKNNLSKDSKLEHVGHKQRVRWWKEITKHLPHVHVHAVYETNNGNFESWQAGADGIKQAVGKPITHVFSSESSYGEFFSKLYPEAEHVVIDEDRTKYPISATKLRKEGVYKNWDLLPEVVRRHYVKKVVVVGTESCGKSTLVQNLATLYNTNHVEEYGRTFYEDMDSYETFAEDYLKIAYKHKAMEEEALKGANKLVFIDTEANVTERFFREFHFNNFSPNGERIYDITKVLYSMAEAQKYDLVIFLEPDVEWVDDGTRLLGDDVKRKSGNSVLKFLLDKHDTEYITINGDYNNRLKESIKLVDKLLD